MNEEDYDEIQSMAQVGPSVGANKSKKPLYIVLSVILVLAIAVGSYFLLTYLNKDSSGENKVANNNTTQTETTPVPDYAQEMIDKIETELTAQLGATYPEMELTTDNNAPVYKAPGTNYYVSGGEIGKGVSVKPVATSTGVTLDQAASDVVTNVINKTIASDATLTVTELEWATRYQDDKLTCIVMGGGDPVFVNCANISDYSDLVAELAPFAEAYYLVEDNKQYEGVVSFGKPVIATKSDGYKNATVSMGSAESPMGGFAGLFYAKANDWSFFRGTQSVLSCADYDSVDIQKAFEGDKCYDADNAESVVVVDPEV